MRQSTSGRAKRVEQALVSVILLAGLAIAGFGVAGATGFIG